MSTSANVRSLERLEGFLEHCQRTRAQLLKELENLQTEVQRLTNWLENDAARYWEGELKQARRDWVEAEQALLRCRSVVRESDRRPCTEQRKRFEVASERRAFCERQVRFVREALQMWQSEITKLDSKVFRTRDLAETELAVAISRLKEQLGRLDEYSRMRSGAVTALESPTNSESSPIETNELNATPLESTPEAPPKSRGTGWIAMRRISHDMSGIAQRLNHIKESFGDEVREVSEVWIDAKGRTFLQQHTSSVEPTIAQLMGAMLQTTDLFESIVKKLHDPKIS